MNRKQTITLVSPVKLYSSLKFEEKGLTSLKIGETVTFEETGKIHTNSEGKDCKVLRLRKNTRNYYILEEVQSK
jgi:hypothetical protein